MNEQFLRAILGELYTEVHVTSFIGDPNNISNNMIAWSGGRYKNYPLSKGNQYFTISLFDDDENGTPRRRKNLYKATYCIVLDDVREKLAIEQVNKLPKPSWILETSVGSEQWGYILDVPCTDRAQVENLTDGLIENGLAPNGKDPGMKGVTRYVRLPDGTNGKKSKLVNGQPFDCKMLDWSPSVKVSLKQLATPFGVDLSRDRRECNVDGATDVPDHPLMNSSWIKIKGKRSDGRYDITCPWVDEHTRAIDDGAAMFTNEDGTLGFKCHHGSCEHRTGKDLIDYLDTKEPGWADEYQRWKLMRSFDSIDEKKETPVAENRSTDDIIEKLRRAIPSSKEQFELCTLTLKYIATLPTMHQIAQYKLVRDTMGWSEAELKKMINESKSSDVEVDFYGEVIFVTEQNQFYDRNKKIWYSPDAYQNAYAHMAPDARKKALEGGLVVKVDKADYAPKMPAVFEQDGVIYGNTWDRDSEVFGKEGDCQPWLDHFDKVGWGQYRKHILQWMAFTIRYPERKINHAIVLGSEEGIGKDWLLYPLVSAMGCNGKTIAGEELLSNFNEFMMGIKHLHVNELESGNRDDIAKINARIKPLAAAPPESLRINQKGVKTIDVRNLLSVSICTNDKYVLKNERQSRRLFAVWSDLDVRNHRGDMLPEWREYWREMWPWMKDNWQACVWYLRNVVDLSDFHSSEAPPVTDYLRELQKTPDNVVSFL